MLRRALALAALLLFPVVASAHGLDMTVKVANGTVTVTLIYADDTPCGGAVVKVLNVANEVVAEGKSDANGVCVLPAPPPGDYTVRAKTDDGHASTQPLAVSADPTDSPTTLRPPRLLLVGLGLLGITALFSLLYWFSRTKRATSPPAR